MRKLLSLAGLVLFLGGAHPREIPHEATVATAKKTIHLGLGLPSWLQERGAFDPQLPAPPAPVAKKEAPIWEPFDSRLAPPGEPLAQGERSETEEPWLSPVLERGQFLHSDDVIRANVKLDLRAAVEWVATKSIKIDAGYGLIVRGADGAGALSVLETLGQKDSPTYLSHGPWLALRFDF